MLENGHSHSAPPHRSPARNPQLLAFLPQNVNLNLSCRHLLEAQEGSNLIWRGPPSGQTLGTHVTCIFSEEVRRLRGQRQVSGPGRPSVTGNSEIPKKVLSVP